MNRTMQSALRRLRKAQDNIFNSKCPTEGATIDVTVHSPDSKCKFRWWSICVQKYNPSAKHDFDIVSFMLDDETAQTEIDEMFEGISKFLNYTV